MGEKLAHQRGFPIKSIKTIASHSATLIVVAAIGFLLALGSIVPLRIEQMGIGDFWVETVLPLPYWIGIAIIACAGFFALRNLTDKRSLLFLVCISIVLIIGFRMFYPITVPSIIAYEPDATNYLKVVNSWVQNSIDFGHAGNYEHDYPLAYLIAYGFIKLGVPMDTFFRAAPFAIYIIDLVLLFFIISEISPTNKKLAAVATFLYSFSSLGYWVAVHWCPDIVGSMFFFISLYLCIRFAIKGSWSMKALAPVLVSIVFLVLSHHLTTLYFILALLGLALSTWFFNPPMFKGKAISFFLLGIFAYTFWFAYGTLMYPNFFNVYSYFSGYGSTTGLVQQAGWSNNFSFLVYPAFIIGLFLYQFVKTMGFKSPRELLKPMAKIREIRVKESLNAPFVFAIGFIFVLLLFFVGFVFPVSFPTRVLEVLSIGLLPLSSEAMLYFSEGKITKKTVIIMLIILLLVVLIGIHRYDSQIQRRVVIEGS